MREDLNWSRFQTFYLLLTFTGTTSEMLGVGTCPAYCAIHKYTTCSILTYRILCRVRGCGQEGVFPPVSFVTEASTEHRHGKHFFKSYWWTMHSLCALVFNKSIEGKRLTQFLEGYWFCAFSQKQLNSKFVSQQTKTTDKNLQWPGGGNGEMLIWKCWGSHNCLLF